MATKKNYVADLIRKSVGKDYTLEIISDQSDFKPVKGEKIEFAFFDISFFNHKNLTSIADYKEALCPYREYLPGAPLIILAPYEKSDQAVKAVRADADNYLTLPINPEEVRYVLEDTYDSLRQSQELDYLRDEFWYAEDAHLVRTRSTVMQKVLEKIKSVSSTKSTVLLLGETGTGKGVISQLIHKYSNRKNGPYINLHCGAIPENLVESELFGHEKGSFTGAIRKKLGKFELASRGTIFLDEIGTVSKSVQVKLLKVLQDKTFQRVGGEADLYCDARIVSASNADIKQLCEQDKFRWDLFYRLNVFPIEVPPLRERMEDIPLLSEGIIKKLNDINLKDIEDIHPQVVEAFKRYAWPGNIRELENLIERAYILETSSVLTPESFPSELFEIESLTDPKVFVETSRTLAMSRQQGVENIERSYLKAVLKENKGKINLTASRAGVSTRQLHKLLSKYGISKEEFKNKRKTQ
ncbi:sigma 54-interacting transcriptional regulator [Fibrobacterota bacterium]